MRTLKIRMVLFLIPLTAFSIVPVWPAEPPLKKVTVAYAAYSPAFLWFLLEKELGYFREEGLSPECILLRGAGLAARGLIAGNFDYIVPAGTVVEAVVRARQPLKIILTARMANFWLVAQPGVRSIADLKGKTVGAMGPGSVSEFTMREMLRRQGLDPLRDVTLLVMGEQNDRFAALISGRVQATLLIPPLNFKAVEMGYQKLASATDYMKWPLSGLATREEKFLRDPEEVRKMVRASIKGLRFMQTHREYVIAKMTQIFKLSQDEAIKTYEIVQEETVHSGYLSEEAQRQVIAIAKQAANVNEDIPPERVFDDRFVKQVEIELKNWTPQAPK